MITLGVLYVKGPDATGMPRADAETAIHDAPMDLSASTVVRIGMGETPPAVNVTYDPVRMNVGNSNDPFNIINSSIL